MKWRGPAAGGDPALRWTMYNPQSEATVVATSLRARAATVPPERRLKVPGATREVLGLHKRDLLGFVNAWLEANSDIGEDELFATARQLWEGSTREEQFVASRILGRRPKILERRTWEQLWPWLDAVDSVEGADAAAIYAVAPWVGFDVVTRLSSLRSLLEPGNLVGRRVGLVATAALRSEDGYPEVVFEFVGRTIADREPLVVDAVVWALCALSRHHRPLVERFLAESDGLDRLAREQVENWLRTGSRRGLVEREWRLPAGDTTTGA